MTSTALLIDDTRRAIGVAEHAARTVAVEDPGTGGTIASVLAATPADCIAALEAADRAFPAWSAAPARARTRVLRRAADYLEWSSGEAVRIAGRIDGHPEGGCQFVVRRRPVGPA
jgi:succinate-semialdehyde dehydrogenase/glutarate-semialdehyde dehydrogenase